MAIPVNNSLPEGRWLALWLAFFLSPFFWPYIHGTATAFSLLALATGLGAAAAMWQPMWKRCNGMVSFPLVWLVSLLLPGFLLLIMEQVRNPWGLWQQSLFMTAAWLVFAFSRSQACRLISSHRWVLLLAVIGHVYAIYAVMQWFDIRPLHDVFAGRLFPFWSQAWQANNLAGPLAQQNLQGIFLCVVLVALFSRVIDATSNRWWLWWLGCLLPSMNLIGTGSRGSLLVFIIGISLVIIVSRHRKLAVMRIVPALFLGGVLYWVLYGFWAAELASIAGESGKTLVEAFQERGIASRLMIWDLCLRLFMEHPWLGLGLGNLASYSAEGQALALKAHPEWAELGLYTQQAWAHNSILQLFVEAGLIGGAAILVVYVAVSKKMVHLLQKRIQPTDGAFQGCLGCGLILLHGLVSVSMFNAFFMVLMALYAASAFSTTGPTDA